MSCSTVVPVSEYNPVAFDLRPRMMVSEGCSGSTYALKLIREMMAAHWTAPINFHYPDELMKCDKNPECKSDSPKGVALGVQIAVAKSVLAGTPSAARQSAPASWTFVPNNCDSALPATARAKIIS